MKPWNIIVNNNNKNNKNSQDIYECDGKNNKSSNKKYSNKTDIHYFYNLLNYIDNQNDAEN